MPKPAPNQRASLLALIEHQTPEAYQAQAQAFIKSAELLKLSPITINHLFLLGRAGTKNQPYDLRNLAQLAFSGIDYDVTGTSVTGQHYNTLSVRFKNKQGEEEHLGWTTASKLIEANKRANIMDIPALMAIENATPQDYDRAVKENDYARTLEEAIAQEKTIQSTKERRQVQHLQDLDNAIAEASKGLYKDFVAFLASKDYFSENAMHYKELLLPTGGLIKRMQARDNLSPAAQEALVLVTKHKKQLPTSIYAEKMSILKAEDELTTLLDAEGHLKRYLSDLQLIGREGKITGKPQEILHAMQQLHEGKAVMSAPEILPFLMLYDINGERIAHHEQDARRSEALMKDYAAGVSWLQDYFIQGPSWKGGSDESIPGTITKALEGLVKTRADPHLKEAQELFRTVYGSGSLEEAITKMSIEEARTKTRAITVLERRKQAKEKTPYKDVIKEDHRLNEDFATAYGITIDALHDRMQDRSDIAITDDTKKKLARAVEDRLYEESTIDDIKRECFGPRNKLEELISLNRWSAEDQENYERTRRIINHPAIVTTSGFPWIAPEPKKYIKPEESAIIKGWEDLEEQLGDPAAWQAYEEAVRHYKQLQREHPKGYTLINDNSASGKGIEATRTYHESNQHALKYSEKNEQRHVVMLNPDAKDEMKKRTEELQNYQKLDQETVRKANSLLTFKEEAHKIMERQGIPHDTKTWSLFNTINHKINEIRVDKFQRRYLNHLYIDKGLAERINNLYGQALKLL